MFFYNIAGKTSLLLAIVCFIVNASTFLYSVQIWPFQLLYNDHHCSLSSSCIWDFLFYCAQVPVGPSRRKWLLLQHQVRPPLSLPSIILSFLSFSLLPLFHPSSPSPSFHLLPSSLFPSSHFAIISVHSKSLRQLTTVWFVYVILWFRPGTNSFEVGQPVRWKQLLSCFWWYIHMQLATCHNM